MTKTLKLLISIIIVIIIVLVIIGYWQHEKYYPSTDDAYVQANIVHIASEVSGPVASIEVENNQQVKKGQLLFTIDPKPFRYALSKAVANFRLTKQKILSEQDAIKTAQAEIKQREAELLAAKKTYDRYKILVKQGQATASEGDQTTRDYKTALAALAASQSNLLKAKAALGTTGANNADLKLAMAQVQTATLNLSHTRIYAPDGGIITRFKLRIGDVVTANEEQFSLIANDHWWVNANFKETDLTRIKPGQKAFISVDMYPGHTFKGTVQSISSGSGEAFSLLPPENASGNWVKVTQRFPVKVSILDPNARYPLRVGASSTVIINTK